MRKVLMNAVGVSALFVSGVLRRRAEKAEQAAEALRRQARADSFGSMLFEQVAIGLLGGSGIITVRTREQWEEDLRADEDERDDEEHDPVAH